MRTIIYGGAVSLDGFLADANGAIDWIHHGKDVQEVMRESWKNVDAILMGRKTYEFAASQMRGAKKPAKKAADSETRKAPTVRTYIFSRTLQEVDYPDGELVRGDAVEFVRELKQRPGGKIILMGGGELAQALLGADLVDEVGLNIHPILLGSGVPTFRDAGHRLKLNLKECRQIDGGCILAKYTVAHAKLARAEPCTARQVAGGHKN